MGRGLRGGALRAPGRAVAQGSVWAQGWSGGSEAVAAAGSSGPAWRAPARTAFSKAPEAAGAGVLGASGAGSPYPRGRRRKGRRSRAWTEGLRGEPSSPGAARAWHFPEWELRAVSRAGARALEGRPQGGSVGGDARSTGCGSERSDAPAPRRLRHRPQAGRELEARCPRPAGGERDP